MRDTERKVLDWIESIVVIHAHEQNGYVESLTMRRIKE